MHLFQKYFDSWLEYICILHLLPIPDQGAFYACLESARSELACESAYQSCRQPRHPLLPRAIWVVFFCLHWHGLLLMETFACVYSFVRLVKFTKACIIVMYSLLVWELLGRWHFPFTHSFILKTQIENENICVLWENLSSKRKKNKQTKGLLGLWRTPK